MNEFFHILGMCPDAIGHIDLLDIFIFYYNQIIWLITKNI